MASPTPPNGWVVEAVVVDVVAVACSSAYHYSQYYHYILFLIFLPALLQQHLLLPLLLLPLLVLVTSPSLTAIQVALEDLVLGAPGSPASPDLKDLIIVTGVGNNSPGVLPGLIGG